MKLLLVRHGNTFGPGDTPVWIGAGEDLPLVESGKEQARSLGRMLAPSFKGKRIAVKSANLRRAREAAELLCSASGVEGEIQTDSRLNELDYGPWAGRTTDDLESDPVRAEELLRWNESAVWPPSAPWGSKESAVLEECSQFLHELVEQSVPEAITIAVSSNGRLRCFARIVCEASGAALPKPLKVATGAFCLLQWKGDHWEILHWNRKADEGLMT